MSSAFSRRKVLTPDPHKENWRCEIMLVVVFLFTHIDQVKFISDSMAKAVS